MTPEQQPISQPQRIDRYVGQYAERAVDMVASEIRALFAVAARPEIVSLAGGSPYVAALPLDVVGEMIGQLIATQGATALQYCTAQGDAGLRERICDVMALEQIRAHPDEVVVTVGSQQALDLLARIFIDPGDVVLVEAPSYVGALGAFAAYQADVVHVAMDDDGLIPEALEEAIRRTAAAGRRAKFLYTVPNFHNPAGVTLAAGRRHRILDICHRAGLLVVEDNPYGLLGFDGEPMRALRADDAEGVVYLGTFSKTFAAGVRVGWAVAPTAIREKLILAAESAVLCHSSFSQLTVREYLNTQPWFEQIKDFRELYRERRDATLNALSRMMPPECHWTRPACGFYVWLRLPDGVNAKAMLPRAISSRVAYVPGTGFYADGSGGQYARLCYSFPDPDRIGEGVRRLASVIETEVQLRDDFGPASDILVKAIYQNHERSRAYRRTGRRPVPGAGSVAAVRGPGLRRPGRGGHPRDRRGRRLGPALPAARRPAQRRVPGHPRRLRRGRRDQGGARAARRAVRRLGGQRLPDGLRQADGQGPDRGGGTGHAAVRDAAAGNLPRPRRRRGHRPHRRQARAAAVRQALPRRFGPGRRSGPHRRGTACRGAELLRLR